MRANTTVFTIPRISLLRLPAECATIRVNAHGYAKMECLRKEEKA